MKRTSVLAAVVVATTTLVPTTAHAAPVSPTASAGDWMVSELTDGLAVGQYGPDTGLSIDAGLAFDGLGRTAAAESVAEAIGATLVTTPENPYGYVSSDEYDWQAPYDFVQVGRYANATAKAAAFVQRLGRDAASAYPAVDLVAQLEELTDDATGVIADDSSFGDYANTIGQAFAAEALTVAGSDEAAAATAALLAQQCPAGYFRFGLEASPCAADTTGVAPDTTGLAVLSLLASGASTAAVEGALADAVAWLESRQLADGSFEGDAAAPGSNTNSTGVAGWALGAAGHDVAAGRAAAWVRALQVADAGACVAKAPTGAIAYQDADLTAGRADGIAANPTVRDKWRRATFQSAPVLTWAPAAGAVLSLATPAEGAGGSDVKATVRGLAPGQQACVSLGAAARRVVGTGTDVPVTFTLPVAAGTHTFTVATLGDTATATTRVRPAPTAEPATGRLVAAKVEKVRRNHTFRLAVRCEGPEACAGKVKVRTARKVERRDGTRLRRVIAKARYDVAAGERAVVRLRLTKPARRIVGTERVKVAAVQVARGGDRARTTFWLRRK